MIVVPLLLQVTAAQALAEYSTKVTGAVRCPRGGGDEVVVCARRDADRYRVPLKTPPMPGDPKHEGVHEERDRLLVKRNECAEKSSFLVGCGFAGVTVGNRTGVRLRGEERPLAP